MKTHPLYRHLPLLGILIAAYVLTSINRPYGIGEDSDSFRVLDQAREWIQTGMVPSRTWGFPLFEVLVYPTVHYFGVEAAKALSLFWLCATLIVFYLGIFEHTKSATRATLGTLCLLVVPVIIISGNSLLETSQGLFFAVSSFLLGLRALSKLSWSNSLAFTCLAAAATLTRPDYILIFAAWWLSVSWVKTRAEGLTYDAIKIPLATGLLFTAIVLGLNAVIYGANSIPFFGGHALGVVIPDPLWRKAMRAAFGIAALFGIPGLIAALIMGTFAFRRKMSPLPISSLLFAGLLTALFLLRYVFLPDELEYIAILVALAVFLLSLTESMPALLVLCVALALPNIVQLAFFQSGTEGNLKFTPSIESGAMAQDRVAQQRMNFMATEFSALAHNFGKTHECTDILLSFPSKSPAENSDCIIVPRSMLRFLDPRRGTSCTSLPLLGEARIFVFDWDSTRDWRQFIAQQNTPLPIEITELTPDEYQRIGEAKAQCGSKGP